MEFLIPERFLDDKKLMKLVFLLKPLGKISFNSAIIQSIEEKR